MKIKELLLLKLKEEGITHIFMVPGGLVDPFLTAFDNLDGIKPIIAAQEGGAGFMADGYARSSKKFGTCLCIGGPGATNTVTPLLTAKSDSSPLLVITGEVATYLEGLGMFQDASVIALDDLDILKPATKLSFTIKEPRLFPHHIEHALKIMLSSRRSPVHICIPTNIQDTELEMEAIPLLDNYYYTSSVLDMNAANECITDLTSTKIVILAGDGIDTPEGAKTLKEFSETLNIPVATTLRAKGVFPEDHPLSLGVFGYAGTAHAINALLHEQLEVLVVIGSGLNQRDSMNWTTQLSPSKRFIQVNTDITDCITSYSKSHLVQGDGRAFLDHLLKANIPSNLNRKAWIQAIKEKPRLFDPQNQSSDAVPIHPARVIHDLREIAPRNTMLVVDSGAHRAFAGHYWISYAEGEYISATNLGPMGWAIPASIGVKLGCLEKPCCVITGDGCMLMHGMEIQTAARYNIPIVFVVINNNALGNVFLRAEKLGKIPMEMTSLPDHDWASFAKSLGLQSETVRDPYALKPAFKNAFDSNKPYLIDVKCDKHFSTPVGPFAETKKTWSYHD